MSGRFSSGRDGEIYFFVTTLKKTRPLARRKRPQTTVRLSSYIATFKKIAMVAGRFTVLNDNSVYAGKAYHTKSICINALRNHSIAEAFTFRRRWAVGERPREAAACRFDWSQI